MNYTIRKIAGLVGVNLPDNSFTAAEIKHIIIDSRSLSTAHNSAFFAIKGQRNDGHVFIPELYKKGIRCFIIEQAPEHPENYVGAFFIKVPDTVKALQHLAAYHRSQFSIPVIGITGSNGKTIVKEWLFQLMREDKNIVRNPKSYNSQVGVPLSVWQLAEENELGIFEAGISLPGEMEKLEVVIQPTIGIFTTIGEAHSENFKDRIQKIREKLKLFSKSDRLIFCSDYADIEANVLNNAGQKLIRWSKKKRDADYFVSIVQESMVNSQSISSNSPGTDLEAIDLKGLRYHIRIPFIDDGSIENAIHCWVLMLQLGYENQVIQRRMLQLSPVAMRLEMKEGMNNCLIINDSYNSDLGSLTIALDFLNQQKQFANKTIILSDILQSGKNEGALYEELAQLLAAKGITRLIGIGAAIRRQEKLFTQPKSFYESTEAFLNQYHNPGFHNEAILIKGARSFGFEKITKVLQQKAHETVMEVDLNAVVHNLNYFHSRLRPGVKLMAMVKASSYGSGSYEIANVLQFHRVDYLAVAYADEGVELRKAGITLPIMVMNPEEQGYDAMIQYDLEPEIFSMRIVHI